MAIKIQFFALYRERFNIHQTHIDAKQDSYSPLQIWQQLTKESELPANALIAVNQEYASADVVINDGDEVAFFPPVTGG